MNRTDDSRDTSSFTTSTGQSVKLLRPSLKTDALPLLLALVSILGCLFVSLITYFLVQKQDFVQIQAALDQLASEGAYRIEVGIASADVHREKLSLLMEIVNPNNLSFWNDFVPFVESGGGFPKQFSAITTIAIVKPDQRASFVEFMRSKGPPFTNFTLFALYPNNTVIEPYPYYNMSYINTAMAPPTPAELKGLGFDYSCSQVRMDPINRVFATRKASASAKMVYGITDFTRIGCSIFTPVFNSTQQDGEIVALTNFAYLLTTLIMDAVGNMTSNVVVSVLDNNATTPDENFLYNTLQYQGDNVGPIPMTPEENMAMINNSQFTTTVVVPFCDRTWNVVFIATESFIQSNSSIDKYIGIIVSVCTLSVLLGISLFMCMLSRLRRSGKSITKTKNALAIMKENQSKLNRLLSKLAAHEHRSRTVLDLIDDVVITINKEGKILLVNANFENIFKNVISNEQMAAGAFIGVLFPTMEYRFFAKVDISKKITTKALIGIDQFCTVTIGIRDLSVTSSFLNEGEVTMVSFGEEGTKDTADEEAYALVIKCEDKEL
jgi:CHASE1-domain containing sensor protein